MKYGFFWLKLCQRSVLSGMRFNSTGQCARLRRPNPTTSPSEWATRASSSRFTAGSICVALGNYHNMDTAKKKIAPEYIDLADWNNMVKLFAHVARSGHEFEPGHKALRERVEKRFEKLKHLL